MASQGGISAVVVGDEDARNTQVEDFVIAHRALRRFLDSGTAVDQKHLEWMRFEHRIRGPLSVTLRVNTQTGELTDLPRRGANKKFVEVVKVSDCLLWQELCRVARNKAGQIARRILIDIFARYLQTRIAASTYCPRMQTISGARHPVHNDLVTLQLRWDSDEISKLRAAFDHAGVFEQVVTDERFGTPFTSLTQTNPDMRRQWVTDSCMAGLSQRERRPDLWWRNLVTNAGFHLTEANVAAVMKTVRNPDWYRKGDARRGVAHIFLPFAKHTAAEGLQWDDENEVPVLDSIQQDPIWGNRKRLESQALMAYWLSETLVAGAFRDTEPPCRSPFGRPWGFPWASMTEMQKDYVIKALQLTMMYLHAVQRNGDKFDFGAPTVSSWEEAPFDGGCASDTGFMVDAARSVRRLLFFEQYDINETIAEIRQRLKTLEIRQAASLLRSSSFADFRQKSMLDAYILAGQRKLSDMVVAPILEAVNDVSGALPWGIRQFEERGPDASLALLAAYHEEFSRNPYWDAVVRYNIVRFLQAHLMDRRPEMRCGMRRYGTYGVTDEQSGRRLIVFDSYINLHFHPSLVVPGLFESWYSTAVEQRAAEIRRRGFPVDMANAGDEVVRIAEGQMLARAEGRRSGRAKDTRQKVSMAGRQYLSFPQWSAQWSIGPTACIIALAKAKVKVLTHIEACRKIDDASKRREAIEDANELRERMEQTLTEFINLCAASVVGDKDARGNVVYRADGTRLPGAYNVMEAFQACVDVYGNVRWIAGEHTLPWSASQLFEALKLVQLAAELEERVLARPMM